MTEYDARVKAFFIKVFFSSSTSEIHHSAFYQITPEAYMQFLDYESAQQSRKAARQANIIAIAAIIISVFAACLPLILAT